MTEQPFYGSDEEAYIDDDEDADGEGYGDELRDDFSLSDTGAQDYVEDVDIDDVDGDEEDGGDDEERREREFFGDDEYTILSNVIEEEEENEVMSMTMQDRENKQKQVRVDELKK